MAKTSYIPRSRNLPLTPGLQEAADLIKLKPDALRAWAKEGLAPADKPGGAWVFITADLLHWKKHWYPKYLTKRLLPRRPVYRSDELRRFLGLPTAAEELDELLNAVIKRKPRQ